MNDICLYHYYEKDFEAFKTLVDLPMEEARNILLKRREEGKFHNPNIDDFLQNRYSSDKKLREAFIKHGGKPQRTAPIYMTLGEHKQWKSAYENAEVIKIPLKEFESNSISFTYGDSFAIFNQELFGEEEYWNKIYFVDEILRIIDKYGMPPYVEYDFKKGIYPTDKHINNHLKYVEAHIWSDGVLNRYRNDK